MSKFKRSSVLVTMLVVSLATAAAAGVPAVAATRVAKSESCGTFRSVMPSDPSGVLASFPASVQAGYNLYNEPVLKSAWANWKPKGKGPYTVYFNGAVAEAQPIISDFEKLAAHSTVIKKVVVQDNGFSSTTQVQQLEQAVSKKASLIVAYLLDPTADASAITAAGKAGIPVIVPLSASPSKYEIGLDGNEPLQGADLMQGLAGVMGGKGSLLEMQGVPGTEASDDVLLGASDVLKRCPNITIAGKPIGQFAAASAKTATLEFLAAHPQPVTAAIQVGGMATGIMEAFQQDGRAIPAIGDLGATPGALAYWNANKSTYKGVGLALPFFTSLTNATYDVANSLLEGKGLKVNEILQTPLLITKANLSQWVQPGWTESTALPYAPGPSGVWYPDSYLNQFFTK
jgi:ribose transport system substrate-binding protein